jgi:hypothetical protein
VVIVITSVEYCAISLTIKNCNTYSFLFYYIYTVTWFTIIIVYNIYFIKEEMVEEMTIIVIGLPMK